MIHPEAVAADEPGVPEEADIARVGPVDGVALGAGQFVAGLALPVRTASAGDTFGGNEAPSIGPA